MDSVTSDIIVRGDAETDKEGEKIQMILLILYVKTVQE